MTSLEKISKYNPELIDSFIRTGKSTVIPQDVQNVIRQITWAMEIYEADSNISRGARKLQTKVKAVQGIDMDVSTAKSRIYAALNYFDVDCNVRDSVWMRDGANKYEDIKKYAISEGKVEAAIRCQEKAIELRLRASASDQHVSLGVVYVMSPELTAEDLGFTSESMKKIAKKYNSGFYLGMINNLPVPEETKRELRADAEITDVEFEELPSDAE